jgi:hypothetical protein
MSNGLTNVAQKWQGLITLFSCVSLGVPFICVGVKLCTFMFQNLTINVFPYESLLYRLHKICVEPPLIEI